MQSEIPDDVMMNAERLYDEGGYKTVPEIIAEAIMAERERCEAALSAAEPAKPYGYVYESTVRYCDGRGPHRKVDFFHTKKNISDDDIEEFEITETAVYSALSAQVQDVAGWQATLPTYHRYPHVVENISGKWHLRIHHGNGASHTVSTHETAEEAIAAAPAKQEG